MDAGSDPDGSPPSDAGDPGIPSVLANGPFDLVFTEVYEKPSEPYGFGPDAPETHIRLDLLPAGNGYKALTMPLFLEPIEMGVTVAPGLVTLDGSVLIGSEGACGGLPMGMTWEQIRFPIDSGGAPIGTFQASGTALYIPPKVGGGQKAVKANGTILPDTRPPSFMVGPATYYDGSLPWDPIEVIASEPLSDPAWPQALAVAVPNPPPFATVPEGPPGAVLGTRRATVRLTDWNGLGSAVMIDGVPVADGSGNVSMPWSGMLGLIDVGPAVDRLRFDMPMGAVIGSGTNTWVDSATEPLCDTDGCARTDGFTVEPVYAGIGVAGRLAKPAISAVSVRHRFFTIGWVSSSMPQGTPVRLSLVAPGKEPFSQLLSGGDLKPFNGVYVTDWLTATVPLPASLAGATEIGFSIMAPGTGSPDCTPYYPDNTAVRLLVDDVAAL